MTLQPGDSIGAYRIVAALGSGGMGEVYRARDPRLGRDVAIKVMDASYRDDPERRRRFRDEVRAAGALDHPNVLVVHDVGEHDSVPYLVCELLEGATLRSRLAAGPLDRALALAIARQIAEGLAAVHRTGVVHRDLKPGNIMILEDGRAKILDFGIARPVERGDATGTRTGAIIGSTAYMAPEQVRGETVDQRADLFAFGIVLHEMLSGVRPFDADSDVELGYAILKQEPPALADQGIDAIARRCMAKDPAERYQSAHDLAFAIEALELGTRPPRRRIAGTARALSVALVALALGSGAFAVAAGRNEPEAATRRPGIRRPQSLVRVSEPPFRVDAARYGPHGGRLFTGSQGAEAPSLFAHTTESPALAAEVHLLATTEDGQIAVLKAARVAPGGVRVGVLALSHVRRGGLGLTEDLVVAADFLPDGELAVSRWIATSGTTGDGVIEWPRGTEVYRSHHRPITDVRISRDGKRLAFLERHEGPDDLADLLLLERGNRQPRVVLREKNFRGLAWGPRDRELWSSFPKRRGLVRCVQAVALEGGARIVKCATSDLTLEDVSDVGYALVTADRTDTSGTTPARDLHVIEPAGVR